MDLSNLEISFLKDCNSPKGYPFKGEDFVIKMNGSNNAFQALNKLYKKNYIVGAKYIINGNNSNISFSTKGTTLTSDGKKWLEQHCKN